MPGQMMRAAQVTRFDGPAGVEITELPVPASEPGGVRVLVRASGVNWADVSQARGHYAGGPRTPYVPGLEAAGEVLEAPPDSGVVPGQRVMGYADAAFAEQVVWPAGVLLPVPERWSYEQAAAFPVQWLSAHGCLRAVGRLTEGETVLIHAAAGGTGLAAVRLARHYGARVIATASTDHKLALAREHGADHVINYETSDFVAEVKAITGGEGVDLLLEMVGGSVFERNFRVVKPYGRIVVFGAASGRQAVVDNTTLIFKPVELLGYHVAVMARRRPDLMAPALAELMRLVHAGVVNPGPITRYPLADARRALEDLAARRSTGKLVLVP